MDSDGDDDHRGKEEREMDEVYKKWRRGGIGAVGPPDCKECKGGKNKHQEDEDLQHQPRRSCNYYCEDLCAGVEVC